MVTKLKQIKGKSISSVFVSAKNSLSFTLEYLFSIFLIPIFLLFIMLPKQYQPYHNSVVPIKAIIKIIPYTIKSNSDMLSSYSLISSQFLHQFQSSDSSSSQLNVYPCIPSMFIAP